MSDTCRWFENNGELVFLSMYGNRNAVRGCWAKLVGRPIPAKNTRKSRGRYTGDEFKINVGGVDITINPEQRPLSVHSQYADQHHVVMLNPALSDFASAKLDYLLMLGDHTSLVARLSQFVSIPMRREWSEYLWRVGIEKKFIRKFEGFGTQVSSVSKDFNTWLDIVKAGLTSGEIR